MTSIQNPAATRSHHVHQELIMQNVRTRKNQALRNALALALLAGTTTPVWAGSALTSLKAGGLGAEGTGLVGQTVAWVSADREVQETANTVAEVAGNVGTGIAVAETGVAGAAIATGSGAVIMKTLAVTGGPAAMAGATGFTAAKVMNETLYSDCDDQAACDAAQYGTYSGAVVGTGATLATIATVGAGPAGLAAVGSVVGGGMVAGVATLVAVPVVVAALIGGAVYWLVSD